MNKIHNTKKKEKLLIMGAGGHGKVIADLSMKLQLWNIIAFLDDNQNIENQMGINVIGKLNDVTKFIEDYDIFIAIGNNKAREKIQNGIEMMGANLPTLIHPDAVVGDRVQIGAGTVLMAGVVVNCCTQIGKGCIVNTGATIDHDTKVDDYVHISPGVHMAGTVKVGGGTWVGIGSVVSNNVNITRDCIIGAGAVVVNDIIEIGTYIGVPARRVQ